MLMEIGYFAVLGECLHGDGMEQLQSALLSWIGHGGHLEGQLGGAFQRLAGIAHDGGQLLQQGAEAMGR